MICALVELGVMFDVVIVYSMNRPHWTAMPVVGNEPIEERSPTSYSCK